MGRLTYWTHPVCKSIRALDGCFSCIMAIYWFTFVKIFLRFLENLIALCARLITKVILIWLNYVKKVISLSLVVPYRALP